MFLYEKLKDKTYKVYSDEWAETRNEYFNLQDFLILQIFLKRLGISLVESNE